MNWFLTIVGLVFFLCVMALSLFAQRRKPRPDQVRLVPWLAITFLSMVGVLIFARHALTLAGAPA